MWWMAMITSVSAEGFLETLCTLWSRKDTFNVQLFQISALIHVAEFMFTVYDSVIVTNGAKTLMVQQKSRN